MLLNTCNHHYTETYFMLQYICVHVQAQVYLCFIFAIYFSFSATFSFPLIIQARNQRGEGEEVSLTFFRKSEKSALIFGKNVSIVVIYGLNFSYKVQFLSIYNFIIFFSIFHEKKPEIFPCEAFLFFVVDALKNSWSCVSYITSFKQMYLFFVQFLEYLLFLDDNVDEESKKFSSTKSSASGCCLAFA